MKLLSVNELSILTDCTRATVSKKLQGVKYEDGPHAAKLYNSAQAIRLILGVADTTEDGEIITQAEANRQLTIARKAQIDLEMEVLRKERIPLSVVNEINEEVHSNAAGILKANLGKLMTEETVNDIFALFRGIGGKLKAWIDSR